MHYEKVMDISFNVLVNFYADLLVDNTDVHFSCIQIDTAIIFVMWCVELDLLKGHGKK